MCLCCIEAAEMVVLSLLLITSIGYLTSQALKLSAGFMGGRPSCLTYLSFQAFCRFHGWKAFRFSILFCDFWRKHTHVVQQLLHPLEIIIEKFLPSLPLFWCEVGGIISRFFLEVEVG